MFGGCAWILNLKEEIGEIILSFNSYHLVFEYYEDTNEDNSFYNIIVNII